MKMLRSFGLVLMAAALLTGCASLPGGDGGGIVGAIEVPAVAAVEARFAVVAGEIEQDAEPRTAEDLRRADASVDRSFLALGLARAAYDAASLLRPASAGTRHLVGELRAASDAAYARAKRRLAQRLAEAAIPPAAPV
ncbi:MAG TPA: hypothetical protein VF628_02395 [Allosphingosinicella sp.]|jgi:hypothetical protein